MIDIGLGHYLTLSAIIFTIGIVGIFLNRKNVIVILMSIELILLAVNINFVSFSIFLNDLTGQIFALFILTVAAAEAAIGLAIIVVYYRNSGTIMVEEIDNATKNIKEVDFLTLKKPILKSYYQLLMAYSKYLEENFEKIEDYLESAVSYEPLAKTVSELLNLAILLKKDPNNKNITEEFKKLPSDLDEYYFEPFDKLYIELEKKLGIS